MKKLMLVVPICLLAVSGLYAQPTSPARVGKGVRTAKQTVKTAAKKTPAIKEAVETAVKDLAWTGENISEAAYFHRLGSGDFWKEPPTKRPLHWSYYALEREDMRLLSAPPGESTVPTPLTESPRKELIELGMDRVTMAGMSEKELYELLYAHSMFNSIKNTGSRFEPETSGIMKTLQQITWAKTQPDFFKSHYSAGDYSITYSKSFNPKAESMRVLIVSKSDMEQLSFKSTKKQNYPNITLDFASTVKEAETQLEHNEYDIVLSYLDVDIKKGGLSVAMFAHNLGLNTPVIIASSREFIDPYVLYCYNVAGNVYGRLSLDEDRVKAINYLSNVVVNRREKLGF